MALRIRRGLDIERQSIIPAEGEPLYCTDTGMLYIGDGSTIGGNLVTGIKSLLDDPTPALSANLDLNSNNIVGMGDINIVGDLTVSGNLNIDAVKADYRGSLFGDDSTLIVNGFDHTVHASVIGKDGNKLVDTETGEINLQNTTFDNFSNLDTQNAAIGDGVFYDGNTWVAKPFGADGSNNPPNGSILQWVSGEGWMAQTFIMSADSSPMMNYETGEIFLGQTNLESIRNVFIDPNTIEPDQVLIWDGLNWTHKEIDASNLALVGVDLDSLENVYAPLANIDDVLYYDGTNWVNKPAELNILSDTFVQNSTLNQFFVFDGHNWINRSAELDMLFDVVIDSSTLAEDQLLKWNGFHWVNSDVAVENSLGNISIDGASLLPDQILTWDGTAWVNGVSLSSLVVSNSPENHDILAYNEGSGKWQNVPYTLSTLTDVHISNHPGPLMLVYNEIQETWVGKPGLLSDMSDVEGSVSSAHSVLSWDAPSGKWVPAVPSFFALDKIAKSEEDTNLNDVLTWDGNRWFANQLSLFSHISDVNIIKPALDDTLTWDGTAWVNRPRPEVFLGTIQGNVVGMDSTVIVDATDGSLAGHLIGDVLGNVVGNLIGDVEGTVVGTLIGDVEGNVEGTVVGNLIGDLLGDATIKIAEITGDLKCEPTDIGEFQARILGNEDNSVLYLGRKFSTTTPTDTTRLSVIKFATVAQDNTLSTHAQVDGRKGYLWIASSDASNYIDTVNTAHLYLDGRNGCVGIGKRSASYKLDVEGEIVSSSYVQFGSLTSAERDALTAVNGMVIYNTTNNKFEGHQNGVWINLDNGTPAI